MTRITGQIALVCPLLKGLTATKYLVRCRNFVWSMMLKYLSKCISFFFWKKLQKNPIAITWNIGFRSHDSPAPAQYTSVISEGILLEFLLVHISHWQVPDTVVPCIGWNTNSLFSSDIRLVLLLLLLGLQVTNIKILRSCFSVLILLETEMIKLTMLEILCFRVGSNDDILLSTQCMLFTIGLWYWLIKLYFEV